MQCNSTNNCYMRDNLVVLTCFEKAQFYFALNGHSPSQKDSPSFWWRSGCPRLCSALTFMVQWTADTTNVCLSSLLGVISLNNVIIFPEILKGWLKLKHSIWRLQSINHRFPPYKDPDRIVIPQSPGSIPLS